MISWATLAVGLIALANGILSYLIQRGKISTDDQRKIKEQLDASLSLVDKARKARQAAGDAFDARGGVPDPHDQNLRD